MAETFPTRCPNCRTAFRVPAGVVGKKIKCKQCQTAFTAAAGGAAPPPGKAAPVARPVPPAAPAAPAGETFKLADDPAKPAAPASPRRPYEDDEDTGPAEYGVIKGEDEVPRCPFCAKELDPPDTKICLNCGFDLLDRRRHESKAVYELTTGDYIRHHLPAVACLFALIGLVVLDVVCVTSMADWFSGSIFEMDDTDPNTGKKKYYLPPLFCNVWIVVPSLFLIWKCGKFAGKRFFINWRPPETLKT